MMRNVFILCTLMFWLGVAGFWITGRTPAPLPVTIPEPATPAAPVKPAMTSSNKYTMSQVAAHHTELDCWMAIDGKVYDVTAYLPNHPSAPDIILAWCGKESSEAYATKTKGRSHSTRADKLLEKYLLGDLQ